MVRLWSRTSSPVARAAGLGILTALAVTARPWTTWASGQWVLSPAPGLFVLAGLGAGPGGLLAAAGGYLVGNASVGPGVLAEMGGLLILGAGTAFLKSVLSEHHERGVPGLAASTVVAAVAGGSLKAWALSLIGQARYVPTVGHAVVGYSLPALFGVFVFVLARPREPRRPTVFLWRWPTPRTEAEGVPTNRWGEVAVPVAVVTVWVIFASGASAGVQVLRLVPATEFGIRGLGFMIPIVRLAGEEWFLPAVQGIFGGVSTVLLVRWGWRMVTRGKRG